MSRGNSEKDSVHPFLSNRSQIRKLRKEKLKSMRTIF